MAKIIRICPHCYELTGDTYEFNCTPPVGITCEDCGSALQPQPPADDEPEGWLYDRDYSEPYEYA